MLILISGTMLGPTIGPSDNLGVLIPPYKVSSSTLKASRVIPSSLAHYSIVALV
jgi:hypothetical protein